MFSEAWIVSGPAIVVGVGRDITFAFLFPAQNVRASTDSYQTNSGVA